MAPIPTSDMPGHKRLHERAFHALDRLQEAQGIDFKESAPWDVLQWRIIKTVLAMGNLRDGGIVIVGVSQRDDTWDLTGISAEHLSTYDVDAIVGKINAYVSPHADLDIVTVTYRNGKTFLVFQANEFSDTPLVCKKDGPPESKGLTEGTVYLRPPRISANNKDY